MQKYWNSIDMLQVYVWYMCEGPLKGSYIFLNDCRAGEIGEGA